MGSFSVGSKQVTIPLKAVRLIIAGVVAVPAGAAAPIRVVYQGQTVTTSGMIARSADGTLVPLRATAEALGGQVTWDAGRKSAVVMHLGHRLEVEPMSHTVRVDGRLLTRFAAPPSARGQALVPLRVVERFFRVRGQWLPAQRLLRFAAAEGGPAAEQTGTGAEVAAGEVRLQLTTDRRAYAAGMPVSLTLTVRNAGRSPVTLEFSSGQKYDFEVRRDGQVVWRWAAERMFTQALTSLTLAAGERKSFTEVWKQQDNAGKAVPAGNYEVVAVLTTMERPQPRTGAVSIRIGG